MEHLKRIQVIHHHSPSLFCRPHQSFLQHENGFTGILGKKKGGSFEPPYRKCSTLPYCKKCLSKLIDVIYSCVVSLDKGINHVNN